jgi:uncharacterized membrane protein
MQASTCNYSLSLREVERGCMATQLFLSGVILGLLVGILLDYCLLHRLLHREEKHDEIDRLVMQFQELFRQIDRDKEI